MNSLAAVYPAALVSLSSASASAGLRLPTGLGTDGAGRTLAISYRDVPIGRNGHSIVEGDKVHFFTYGLASIGMLTVNVVPLLTSLSMTTVPPWLSVTF